MAEPLATVTDVESLWRPLTETEQASAGGLLRYASAIVRARVPGIDERIDAGTLDGQLVSDIVASMVVRALRNPTGFASETVGPYAYAVSDRVAAGYLTLFPEELEMLALPPSTRSAVGSIRLYPGLWPDPGKAATC